MPSEFTGVVHDLHLRHTTKDGGQFCTRHRVWSADLFLAARAADAQREGGRARVEVITAEQYKDHAK